MNILSKSLFLAGGVAAAAGIAFSGKRAAKCKNELDGSPPSATWGDQDYCFYCGRGGNENKVREEVTVTTDLGAVSDTRSLSKRMSNCCVTRSSIARARSRVQSAMIEFGVPGCVVAVMKDGRLVWSEGLGLADVENEVHCSPGSVMRIASICKPLSAVALLQLYQAGKVDLDAPIQKYVPAFPEKTYNGEKVSVTLRHLMTHMAGIRHYVNKENDGNTGNDGERKTGEFSLNEYYIKRHFSDVADSLKLFSDDDLISKPGSSYNYSTFGWTLVEAVIENASGMPYLKYMNNYVFRPLNMSSTKPEFHKDIIMGRSKHYFRTAKGSLSNVPFTDLSYKWAGGGFLSNAEDLVKFGSAVLNCWHHATSRTSGPSNSSDSSFLLQPATTKLMLTKTVLDIALKQTSSPPLPSPNSPVGYGLGWYVREPRKGVSGGRDYSLAFGHTGGAVGACSVLVVLPGEPGLDGGDRAGGSDNADISKGVVTAIIFNLQEVNGIFNLGLKVAEEFVDVE